MKMDLGVSIGMSMSELVFTLDQTTEKRKKKRKREV